MASKKFPSECNPRGVVKPLDKVLIYNSDTRASDEFSTVGQLTKIQDDAINALDTAKVDKVEGKSLILDTEIARLSDVTNQTLDGLGGEATANKKSTINESDTEFPTSKAVFDALTLKIDKTSITSELGDSEELVMSQKTVTEELLKSQLFDRVNIEASNRISAKYLTNGATADGDTLVIPVGSTGNLSYQSTHIRQDFLDSKNGQSIVLRCVFDIVNTSGVLTATIKNGATWATLSTGAIKNLSGNIYYADFAITINNTITNHQVVLLKPSGNAVTAEMRISSLSIFPFALSIYEQSEQVKEVVNANILETVQPQIDGIAKYISVSDPFTGGTTNFTGANYYLGGTFLTMAYGYEQAKDYLLETIQVQSNAAGVARFAIGYLDQRNLPIISKEFSLNVVAGANDINVTTLGYLIPAGETLFVYARYADALEIYWSPSPADYAHKMWIGEIGGLMYEFHHASFPDGSILKMGWTGSEIETIFSFKDDVVQAEVLSQQALDVANATSSKINVIYDRSGNAFDLLIVNGALQVVPKQYSKVLVLSNSTSANGRAYSYGWCGVRGMASSIIDNDYVHQLQAGLKVKNPSAEVIICNLWEWEANYRNLHDLSYYLDSSLAQNPDCIVVRLGENVQNAALFQAELELLINYILDYLSNLSTPIFPALYVGSMAMSDDATKNNALIGASNTFHCPYINVSVSGQEYKERAGNYLWGDQTLDGGATWNPAVQVLYKITSTIISHPNDVGMLRIANQILTAMAYPSVDKLHDITVINNSTAVVTTFSNWVAGGRCNIQVDDRLLISSITAVDAESNIVTITDHEDSVYSFDMPASDITITIS